MRIGLHIGIGSGLKKAVEGAERIGCEAIQIFASNPSAWKSKQIDPGVASDFRITIADSEIHPVVIHTPYLLNLASPDEVIYGKSTAALSDSMQRGKELGAQYVVTHIGSHRGTCTAEGIQRVCEAVFAVLSNSDPSVVLLLENSAGSGDTVGSAFEDIGAIMRCLAGLEGRVGVCLDSAHMWGAGYDVSSMEDVRRTVDMFDNAVGVRWLKLLHLNDTKVELGSHKDRHANIGTGRIGEAGFAALINHPALSPLTGIVETPPREDGLRDIDILKSLRSTSSNGEE